MRNHLLVAVISFIFISSMSDATALTVTGQQKHIEMRGRFQSGSIRSGQQPVQVFQGEQNLEIYFQSNVGKVKIYLERNGETLHQHDVDSATEKTIFIDLSYFEEEEYTLIIINDKGECLTGKFVR